jgi:AcrR family transcriptional regulator
MSARRSPGRGRTGSTAAAPVPEGRRERKARETRERIFREAIALFRLQGFEATRIQEIADRADVSTVTVHNHFRTKDRLLHELAEQYLEMLLSLLEGMAEQARDPDLEPRDFVESARRIVVAWPNIGKHLTADAWRTILETDTGRRFDREMRRQLLELITNLQASGRLRDDLEAGFVTTAVGDLVTGAVHGWLNESTPDAAPTDRWLEAIRFLVVVLWKSDPAGMKE